MHRIFITELIVLVDPEMQKSAGRTPHKYLDPLFCALEHELQDESSGFENRQCFAQTAVQSLNLDVH
jgi:hypothetical protein